MSYYIVTVPNKMAINMLLEKFKKSSIIEQAYITEKVESKPPEIQISSESLNPLNNPRFEKQGYLKEAPYGIDAMYAWSINGGDGTGITFADMEYGW
ncbi:peptidase, partial [Bacillus anthracis]